MEIIPKIIEEYCLENSDEEPEILKKINRDTHASVLNPKMLSGAFQGRLLSLFSNLVRPQYVLEIGTYTAYSAICLAEGLTENGKLITVEVNSELKPRIEKNIEAAGMTDTIELIIGDAHQVIDSLDMTFDLVFIDADKQSYLEYFQKILPKTRKGGLIIIDNVLWSGKVVDETSNDKKTLALRAFNAFLRKDKRIKKVLVPIRDGLTVVRKI